MHQWHTCSFMSTFLSIPSKKISFITLKHTRCFYFYIYLFFGQASNLKKLRSVSISLQLIFLPFYDDYNCLYLSLFWCFQCLWLVTLKSHFNVRVKKSCVCVSLNWKKWRKKSGQDDDWLPRDMKTFFLILCVIALLDYEKKSEIKQTLKVNFLSLYVM